MRARGGSLSLLIALLIASGGLLGCSNELPALGECSAGAAGVAPPKGELVQLVGASASFDDLRYAPALRKVLAVPIGSGTVFLVDPETSAVRRFDGLPTGAASLDASATTLFVADRDAGAILVVDATNGKVLSTHQLDGSPDYVRVSPTANEVWVTEGGRIDVLTLSEANPPALSHLLFIDLPSGPEGLGFDDDGYRAFAEGSDSLIAIDTKAHAVVGDWPTGCFGSHGIPLVDTRRGLVFAGCSVAGGGVVLDGFRGKALAGYEVGQGQAILGYSSALHHFYLRGDPGTDVAFLGVCNDGSMSLLGTATTSAHGHGMAADESGHVWVADGTTGGLLRFTDPYPRTP